MKRAYIKHLWVSEEVFNLRGTLKKSFLIASFATTHEMSQPLISP